VPYVGRLLLRIDLNPVSEIIGPVARGLLQVLGLG
jgi:hypothetical protein